MYHLYITCFLGLFNGKEENTRMFTVKLFGITREIIGSPTIEVQGTISTVGELLTYLKGQYPSLKRLTSVLVAVNNEYADLDSSLNSNDEIALIPPVSGG